jgi:hypothetical protein
MEYNGPGSDVQFEESRGSLNSGTGVSGSNDPSSIEKIVDIVKKNVSRSVKHTYNVRFFAE